MQRATRSRSGDGVEEWHEDVCNDRKWVNNIYCFHTTFYSCINTLAALFPVVHIFLPQNKLLWFNFWFNIFHSRIIGKNVFYMWWCGWWTVSRVCCCPTIEGGGEGAEEGVSRDWGSEGTCVVILPWKTTRLFFFHSTLCNLYKCVLVVRPFFLYIILTVTIVFVP